MTVYISSKTGEIEEWFDLNEFMSSLRAQGFYCYRERTLSGKIRMMVSLQSNPAHPVDEKMLRLMREHGSVEGYLKYDSGF